MYEKFDVPIWAVGANLGAWLLTQVLINMASLSSGPHSFASTSLSMVKCLIISRGMAPIASVKWVMAGKKPCSSGGGLGSSGTMAGCIV